MLEYNFIVDHKSNDLVFVDIGSDTRPLKPDKEYQELASNRMVMKAYLLQQWLHRIDIKDLLSAFRREILPEICSYGNMVPRECC